MPPLKFWVCSKCGVVSETEIEKDTDGIWILKMESIYTHKKCGNNVSRKRFFEMKEYFNGR